MGKNADPCVQTLRADNYIALTEVACSRCQGLGVVAEEDYT